MENVLPLVDLPIISHSIIKVIGVGGGGGNAVNHMYNQGFRDVSFVVCNTDNQALQHSPVPLKIQLGEGLGAGGIPEVAKQAAEDSIDRIKEVLKNNTKMIFITAGMGGGTGTGASPVVAKAAQELGILTVGIVTIPFAFEGKQKIRQALLGVQSLSEYVDALLVINNEKLREIFPDLELSNAFAKADDVLTNAARSIAEIITVPGYINTDFADVYTILKNGNVAIMNTGFASGERRITNAIKNALNSPLLNTNDVRGASKVLLNLYCSLEHQIKMEEVHEINEFMATIGEDIQVIWGASYDESLGENVKITLIATGYEISDIPGMPASISKAESKNDKVVYTVDMEGGQVEDDEREADDNASSIDSYVDKSIKTYYGNTEQGKQNATQQVLNLDDIEEEQIEIEDEEDDEIPVVSLDEDNIDDESVIEASSKVPAWMRKLRGN
ncbi:hypothetical protein MASR2M117_24720 [Paludibacter sp.]